MPVLRHKHIGDYTVIPNGIFRDKALSLRDVGLLCTMLALPDGWSFSIRGLAAIFPHDGRDAVNLSVNQIEAAGYLKRSRKRDPKSGKLAGWEWIVSDLPEPRPDIPDMDAPYPGLPDTAEPCSVNPAQDNIPIVENKKEEGADTSAKPSKSFVPPSEDEVRDYVIEKGYRVDAGCFVDFYETNGWIQGRGKPIKDWRAAVRTWERRNTASSNDQSNRDALAEWRERRAAQRREG